jgi:purine catabolism regulator
VSVESSHRSAIPQAEEAAREHLAGGRTVSFAPGERLEVCACTVGPPTGAPLGVLVAAASPEQGSFATSTCMFAANLLAVALVRADAEDDAAGQVRAAVMAELLHGNVALARRVARALWSGLPLEPVAVVCADGDPAARAAFQADLMPLRRTTRAPAVAFATWQDRLWLVVAAATADSWRARIARGGQLVCGLSGPTPWSGIAQARQQALGELALARCADGGGRVDLVDLLGPDQALGYVRALLGPLADDPELLATLAAWARLDGAIDQVAADLGIHRHTVRRRLARIEAATGLDLRDPRTRHEVWFACTAHDRLM